MSSPLRIGVMGAGSIGCYVGGKILSARAAAVLLIGRARLAEELAAHGLSAQDFDRPAPPITPVPFGIDPSILADRDVVLVCVKSEQTAEVATRLDRILRPDAIVVSLQNGVRNVPTLRAGLAGREVVTAIVDFNVVSRGAGVFLRTMSGSLVFEQSHHPRWREFLAVLSRAGVQAEERRDLAPHQWTKLLVNLNNAVIALSGAPTRDILLTPGYRHVVADTIGEAVRVLRACGITPAKLRGVPVHMMPLVLRLPTPLVRLVTGAQVRLDPEARSSMWEDLTRGRPTEVEFLNGEIVRLAQSAGLDAPLNRRIVELVHDAERAGAGCPGLSAETLRARLTTS